MFVPSPKYQAMTLISAPKIDTDLLWALALFFGMLMLVYFVTVFYFRNRISKTHHKVRQKKRELSPMISEFLFYDENGSKSEKMTYIDLKIQIREMIHYPFDRKVLTDVLMDLRKDVAGQSRKDLFRLYKDLELHKDAYKKLESWRWQVISKGILELTQMQVVEAYGHINRFINDRRPTIRKQAEMATVTLKAEGIQYFLDHTTYSISEWQQVKLIDELKSKESFHPPPFRLWLTSRNNDVVLFSLRLIKHYQQNDAIASIITLVQHKNDQIKKEAILCLKTFNAVQAVPTLKRVFANAAEEIKMYLLDALSHLAAQEDLPFLQEIVENESSFRVKNKAVGAINTISPEVVMPSKDIETQPLGPNALRAGTERETSLTEKEGTPSESISLEHPQNHPGKETTIPNSDKVTDSGHVPSSGGDREVGAPVTLSDQELSFLPWVTSAETDEGAQPVDGNKEIEEVLFTLDFLPIVTSEEKEEEPWETSQETKTTPVAIKLHAIHEMEVDHEIIHPELKTDSNAGESTPSSLNLNQMKVVYEELCGDFAPVPDEGDVFIEWAQVFSDTKRTEATENSEQDLEGPSLDFELNLGETGHFWMPKAHFYPDDIMENMMLLAQIEELGDQREIPFLKEMGQNNASPVIQGRIADIISKFTREGGSASFFKAMEFEPIDSVFHEILAKSDVECKLMLLQEMAQVGDQKEVPLLKTLVNDGNPRIKKMAQAALETVLTRLAPEPNTQVAGSTRPKDPSDGNTLFDQLASSMFQNYADNHE